MGQKNCVILVVEDIPLIRMGIVDLLVEAGFQVLEAETADGAIRILEACTDIHLVFTDVGMPGAMDGIKLSHYIRNRWPPVKLILASGKTILDESQLPVGAKFFAKPYDDSIIIQTIIGMLSEANGEPIQL
jgi:two-component system, response regulator PdtaR